MMTDDLNQKNDCEKFPFIDHKVIIRDGIYT